MGVKCKNPKTRMKSVLETKSSAFGTRTSVLAKLREATHIKFNKEIEKWEYTKEKFREGFAKGKLWGYTEALVDVEREVEKIRREWMKKKIVPNASEVMDEVNMTCGALDVIEDIIGEEEKPSG